MIARHFIRRGPIVLGATVGCGLLLGCFPNVYEQITDMFLADGGGEPAPAQTIPGPEGPAGPGGPAGLHCWDLNGNGQADDTEDTNRDGTVNVLDCRGPQGPPGPAGRDGLACWDRNGNGVVDPNEDLNHDRVVDARDCRGAAGPIGPEGPTGAEGSVGPEGPPGPQGLSGTACWDLNGNQSVDPEEDRNGDGTVDVLDCQAAGGSTLFDFFVQDFWAARRRDDGGVEIDAITIADRSLGRQGPLGRNRAIGYRAGVPKMYGAGSAAAPGNDVAMRLFFHRTGGFESGCLIFTVDALRMRSGYAPEPYGPTRWVRVDLPSYATSAARNDDPGMAIMVDLPLNTAAGLDYADLRAGDRLQFELLTYTHDGGKYSLLDVELYESERGSAIVANATVFRSEQEAVCDEDASGPG